MNSTSEELNVELRAALSCCSRAFLPCFSGDRSVAFAPARYTAASRSANFGASGTFRAIACEVVNTQVGMGVLVQPVYYLTGVGSIVGSDVEADFVDGVEGP